MPLTATLPAQATAGPRRAGTAPAGAFSRLAALSLGSPVDSVAIGDVTGDGLDDVIASTYQNPSGYGLPHETDFKLSVFIQQADGRLATPLQAPFPGFTMHSEGRSIVLVDLDEDGLRDIVLGYGEGIHVFEGAASGQLSGRGVPDALESTKVVVALDTNRDGNVDLATFDGFRIRVYLGDGRGELQLASSIASSPVALNNGNAHMAAGDLNGDGRLDLAVYDGFNQAAVFVQTGSATFEYWPYIFTPYPATYFSGLAVADFDGDGDHDILLGTQGSSRGHPSAKHRLHKQSDGQLDLVTPVEWDAYDIAPAMIGVDMDGDGRKDLLTVRTPVEVVASVGYSRQEPEGSFDVETRFPLTKLMYSTSPRGLAAGDFTGDGCKDIAAASGSYLVLLQAECAPRRVMSRPLPPQLVESPGTGSSGAASAQVDASVDDTTPTPATRRPLATRRMGGAEDETHQSRHPNRD